MYVPQPFKFDNDFFESAREAIRAATLKNGYAPQEVMVHPETEIGDVTHVSVMLGTELHNIALRVRPDLRIGFGLDDNEAMLDVCNPHSNSE